MLLRKSFVAATTLFLLFGATMSFALTVTLINNSSTDIARFELPNNVQSQAVSQHQQINLPNELSNRLVNQKGDVYVVASNFKQHCGFASFYAGKATTVIKIDALSPNEISCSINSHS